MCWRVGNITPISKCGSASSCSLDYLPVTITTVLYAVFEHLMAKRLNNFAKNNHLFLNMQFGICLGLGACNAFLTITNFVRKALDSGCEVCMVGFDSNAASACVNHKALIFILRHIVLVAFLIS